MRLDKYLVKNNNIESRSKAQQLIESGCVVVNGVTVHHKHYDVKKEAVVEVKKAANFVSRGAYKMLGAVVAFGIDFNDKVVLDVGSSTGGFTQIALLNNAKRIYCVDVGTDQLHKSLRENPRVTVYENVNFKFMNMSMFKQKIDIVIADLSFISLTTLLDKISSMFTYHINLYLLIKPQFELTKDIVDRNRGVIKQRPLHRRAIYKVCDYAKELGFKINKVVKSPILGKDGNTEFFVHMEWK